MESSRSANSCGEGSPHVVEHRRLAIDDLPVVVLVFADSLLLDSNAEWNRLSGLTALESAGNGWLDAVHPTDRRRARAATAETEDDAGDVRILSRSGDVHWARIGRKSFTGHGWPDRSVAMTLTVTGPLRDHDRRLHHLANHDELTGLANRGSFLSVGRRGLREGAWSSAVLYIDLDRLKTLNNVNGHRFVDEVLVVVAERIRSSSREGDHVSRLGGDEIGVFCGRLTAEREAIAVAARIEAAIRAPLTIHGRTVVVTASIGIAVGNGSVTAETVIDRADQAMYLAKAAGGGQWATA